MDQNFRSVKQKKPSEQFQYLERWVDKDNFRAFVYDKNGESKLANNYKEFEDLTTSGIWFASKVEASLAKSQRKQKDDTLRSAS